MFHTAADFLADIADFGAATTTLTIDGFHVRVSLTLESPSGHNPDRYYLQASALIGVHREPGAVERYTLGGRQMTLAPSLEKARILEAVHAVATALLKHDGVAVTPTACEFA
jgi:hypothetical protein